MQTVFTYLPNNAIEAATVNRDLIFLNAFERVLQKNCNPNALSYAVVTVDRIDVFPTLVRNDI